MFLRLKSKDMYEGKQQYDGIAENLSDLPTGTEKGSYNGSSIDLAVGSAIYVVEDQKIHLRKSTAGFDDWT